MEDEPLPLQCVQPCYSSTNFDEQALTIVNSNLASELSDMKKALDSKHQEIEHLTAKLSKLNVRNVNKRIKRRDELIAKLKEEVKDKQQVESKLKSVQETSGWFISCKEKNETVSSKIDHLLNILLKKLQRLM